MKTDESKTIPFTLNAFEEDVAAEAEVPHLVFGEVVVPIVEQEGVDGIAAVPADRDVDFFDKSFFAHFLGFWAIRNMWLEIGLTP